MSSEAAKIWDGLLEPCSHCTSARLALVQFNEQLSTAVLVGTTPDPNYDPDLDKPGVLTTGPWEVHCPPCHSTGLVPTDLGRSLIAFVGRWAVRPVFGRGPATAANQDEDDERPF